MSLGDLRLVSFCSGFGDAVVHGFCFDLIDLEQDSLLVMQLCPTCL